MQRVDRRRSFIAVVAAVLLIATSGSAALATTTRHLIESHGMAPQVEDYRSATMTQHGNVLSFRGVISSQTQVSSGPYGDLVAGTETNVFNYDVDWVKGSGFWWGKGDHKTVYEGGFWECSWHGRMVNFAWTGQGVCHGAGTLEGWQWRADLSMDGSRIFHTDGYIFFPGDRSTSD